MPFVLERSGALAVQGPMYCFPYVLVLSEIWPAVSSAPYFGIRKDLALIGGYQRLSAHHGTRSEREIAGTKNKAQLGVITFGGWL